MRRTRSVLIQEPAKRPRRDDVDKPRERERSARVDVAAAAFSSSAKHALYKYKLTLSSCLRHTDDVDVYMYTEGK